MKMGNVSIIQLTNRKHSGDSDLAGTVSVTSVTLSKNNFLEPHGFPTSHATSMLKLITQCTAMWVRIPPPLSFFVGLFVLERKRNQFLMRSTDTIVENKLEERLFLAAFCQFQCEQPTAIRWQASSIWIKFSCYSRTLTQTRSKSDIKQTTLHTKSNEHARNTNFVIWQWRAEKSEPWRSRGRVFSRRSSNMLRRRPNCSFTDIFMYWFCSGVEPFSSVNSQRRISRTSVHGFSRGHPLVPILLFFCTCSFLTPFLTCG